MKYRIIIVLVIVLSIVSVIVLRTISALKNVRNSFAEDLPSLNILSTDDSAIIANEYLKDLKVVEVARTTTRNPVAIVNFRNKYSLLIHNMGIETDSSLRRFIILDKRNVIRTTGISYRVIQNEMPYKFQFRSGFEAYKTNLWLTIGTDSLNTIVSTDSIVCYHLNCGNISIKNSPESGIDLYIVGPDRPIGKASVVPMDVLFLKRNRQLYLLVLASNKNDEPVSSSLLYDIISK